GGGDGCIRQPRGEEEEEEECWGVKFAWKSRNSKPGKEREGNDNEEPSLSPTKVQTKSSVNKEVKAFQDEERKRVAAKETEKSGLPIKGILEEQ
nr:hypothetical protein [Tanacetum cinerariifolium]